MVRCPAIDALPPCPGTACRCSARGLFAGQGVRALDDHLVDPDDGDADIADGFALWGSPVLGAVTGGPVGILSRAAASARAWRISWLFVSDSSVLRSWFWVCDSWIDVPQIWYAVKRSTRTPAPIRIFPVIETAWRTSDLERLGRSGMGTRSAPEPLLLTPEGARAYAATVTRVPSGVSGNTTAALAGGISTQPSLWGTRRSPDRSRGGRRPR